MITRKARLEDLQPLSILFDGYRNFYHKEKDIQAGENFLKERILLQDSEIFVVEEEGVITGFTQLYPLFSSTRMQKYWLLNDLFVEENHRGKGHSKSLLEVAKQLCISTKACGILLETDKSNEIGNRLYPSCGFNAYLDANFYEWKNQQV